ncbi:hypothetical protein BCR36DRAFT_358694 [Piromyces finnis]|uniref:EF-hand domain-containing protein n=1 Tax=Piromyces finnis TaxID=1754191 RepID=A0A1Y1V328_9FUNG|nr:hypothetical protein BCR36DRAFT_358694 [Piromyces finnis]|eukprot:ORX45218.1 hypothetical protein BCR36DRAFT_358694 [Piromyces finnis]
MSDGKHNKNYVPKNIIEYFLQSDNIFTVFFIIESFLSIVADGLYKSVKSLWGLFNIFIFISSILTLCGLTNLSPLRLWIILKYLSRIPLFSDIEMILKALKKSFSVLRDIAVFAIFIFICSGIVGVSLWGGKFKYRCINSENEFYDEDLVCSINPKSGYQCPYGFQCTKVDHNPAYNTMGFDNILQAWLTVFQILTTEGWSGIMVNGINSTNSWSIIYFLIIIMLGNWLLLQLIVATVTSNLEKSIENNDVDVIDESNSSDIKTITESSECLNKIDKRNSMTDSEKSVVLYNSETNNPTIPTNQTVIDSDISDEPSIKTVSINEISTDNNNQEILYTSNNAINSSINVQSIKSKSEKSQRKVTGIRSSLIRIFKSIKFEYFILFVTAVDVIALCSNHKEASLKFSKITQTISLICTITFGVEMILKLYAFGIKKYISSYFNIFDGLITIASIVELIMPHNQGMLVLRVIRAMRIFRISKFSKSLIDLALVINESSKQLLSLAVIWVVSVIIFSAICMQIFSNDMNFDDGIPRANFDSMRNSILSVIQLYTVENWNDIEVSVARSKNRAYILVLIVIIIIGAYVLSQILVAILLSAFTEKIKQDMEQLLKQYVGKQAKFTIKRAFNDLLENVKEKNITFYGDNDDKSYKASESTNFLKRVKHSFIDDNDSKDQKKKQTALGNVKKNNSEPSLVELNKNSSNNMLIRTLNNKRSISNADLLKNLSKLNTDNNNYLDMDAEIAYNNISSNSNSNNSSKENSIASSNTKYDKDSCNSSQLHRRNINQFFNDDTTSLNSSEYSSPVTPSTPNTLSSPSSPTSQYSVEYKKENIFKRYYCIYRETRFVKYVQDLSKNKIYLTFIYFFIISSCICLIYDTPVQKNQELLNILRYLDIFFSAVFFIELIINLIAKGAIVEKKAYLRSFVNWIDVIVIIISIMSAFKIADSVHVFRVLRVLRLFRLVKLHEGMRIVFMAIWKTIPSLATALIPYLFFLIITSAMGLSMFVGEGWQCNDDSVKNHMECTGTFFVDNGTSTISQDRVWERYELSYDNILDSIQTSMVITNQEGWPDIMYRFIDSAGIDQQPIRDNRPGTSVFYILSVLIGNWIFLAVVTGITFDNMKRNQEILKGLHHLTDGQKKLLDYIALIISYKPKPPPGTKKRTSYQQKLYNFFKSNMYEYIAFVVVSINIIIMAIARSDATKAEDYIQIISEYVFTGIYIVEVILLMYAYRPKYFFFNYWNILNLIITVFAIVSIVSQAFSQPNYLSVLRLLRIIRLVKFAKGLKALASAIIFNFYQLMNVTFLMFITCCIFGIIGMHSFGDIDYNKAKALNEHINFSTFPKSLLTVFVFSTGENWPVAMTDCSGRNLVGCDPNVENCGVFWAPVYFLLLEIIFNWILLNSFIAITVDTFLNVLNDLDEINRIETITNTFRQIWLKYDLEGKGVIEFKDMLHIYRDFHIPNNYLWGKKNSGKPIKPSIQKLFRNVIVYNNKCTYADALMSILNSWVGEQLPDDIKLKYWRKRNWDRVYRSSRNNPMNNSLVMPSKEYYKNIRSKNRELERKHRKSELSKYSSSVPNLNSNSESSIFSSKNYNRSDTNYHVRPNLRRSGIQKAKTTSDHKYYKKSKLSEMEIDISSLPMKSYEETMRNIPKYDVPLSTSFLSNNNKSSLVTTPTSSSTPNSNNDSVISSKVLNKGKSVEPETIMNIKYHNSENDSVDNTTNQNLTCNRPMFRLDSFISINSNIQSIHHVRNDSSITTDTSINTDSDINITNSVSKENPLMVEGNNNKLAIRINSSDSNASSSNPHIDITYEINKQIHSIVKNKNNASNKIFENNNIKNNQKVYRSSDTHSSVAFDDHSLYSNSSGHRKPKKYTRVSSSIRNILKPYKKEEYNEDDDFDVSKDVLQFYVVYAIYRLQIKFKRSRKTKNGNKLEVVVKKN